MSRAIGFRSPKWIALAAAMLAASAGASDKDLRPAGGQQAPVFEAPTPFATTDLVVDGGFEQATASGLSAPGWTGSSNLGQVIQYNGNYPHNGISYAVMGFANYADEDLRQTLTIPSSASSAVLSFWVNIVTAETSTTTDYDKLFVEVHNGSGGLLSTPLILGNTDSVYSDNTDGHYFQRTVDMTSYTGQSIQIVFHDTTDFSNISRFRIDDVSLIATSGGGGGGSCVPSSTVLCLNNGRFRVTADWQTTSASGSGTAVSLLSDTGYFWFFNSSNVEVVIKVLNGCGVNNNYWVFAGGLTNVQVMLTVTDTQTGSVRTYTNPINTAFLPIQDTGAFATCP
jgi:hypothetical protein